MVSRPKRRATNAHIFRYLQTRNPSRLEENDLKRALEASLEECPDFWPEDTASCSSSEQSNAASSADSTSGISSRSSSCNGTTGCISERRNSLMAATKSGKKRQPKSFMQQNHLTCNHLSPNHNHNHQHNHHSHNSQTHHCTATSNHCCCPIATVHNRYKPVVKKNIYNEADFFHDGIMQYIEYELAVANLKKTAKNRRE